MNRNIKYIIVTSLLITIISSICYSQDSGRRASPLYWLQKLPKLNATEANRYLDDLTRFKYSDFSDRSKALVSDYLKDGLHHKEKIIKLAGFLDMSDDLNLINPKDLSTESLKNAYSLALARTGNKNIIKTMMSNIEKMSIDDQYVHQVTPMLIYVRQRECIDHILFQILSDEKSCSTSDPESEGNTTCAYRLMELVAPVLIDFPYKLRKSGSLDTDDYKKALKKVRKWINKKQYKYRINTEKY